MKRRRQIAKARRAVAGLRELQRQIRARGSSRLTAREVRAAIEEGRA